MIGDLTFTHTLTCPHHSHTHLVCTTYLPQALLVHWDEQVWCVCNACSGGREQYNARGKCYFSPLTSLLPPTSLLPSHLNPHSHLPPPFYLTLPLPLQSALPLLPPSLGEEVSGGERSSDAAEEIGHIHLPLPSAVQVSHVEGDPEIEEWSAARLQTWTRLQRGRGRETPHMYSPPRNPFEEYLLHALAQHREEPPATPAQSE